MNRLKLVSTISAIFLMGIIFMAADHIDAPNVSGTNADITDFYAFEGENSNSIVFVVNVQGLLSPMTTSTASFDENTLIEINIDKDGDNVEDLVIQAIPRGGKMYVFGPIAPNTTGVSSKIAGNSSANVDISVYGQSAKTATNNGISVFAGPRDDPFFMDFAQYGEIIGGNAGSFNNPGSDTFAGSNVLSLVIEVPKDEIGTSGTINTWVESKIKS